MDHHGEIDILEKTRLDQLNLADPQLLCRGPQNNDPGGVRRQDMVQGKGCADCGRRYYIMAAGMPHAGKRIHFRQDGDTRPLRAADCPESRGESRNPPVEEKSVLFEEVGQ